MAQGFVAYITEMNSQRTPPSAKSLRPGQSSSEPDLSSTMETENKQVGNITVRNKRQRIDDSPNCETDQFTRTFNDFKTEIMEMLTSWKIQNDDRLANWKAEHDAVLAGVIYDLIDLKTQWSKIRESHLEVDRSIQFVNNGHEEIKSKFADVDKQGKETKIALIN